MAFSMLFCLLSLMFSCCNSGFFCDMTIDSRRPLLQNINRLSRRVHFPASYWGWKCHLALKMTWNRAQRLPSQNAKRQWRWSLWKRWRYHLPFLLPGLQHVQVCCLCLSLDFFHVVCLETRSRLELVLLVNFHSPFCLESHCR